MGVQAIDQTIFPTVFGKTKVFYSPRSLTSGNWTLWSFPIPLGKYFDLLPALPLNNCILIIPPLPGEGGGILFYLCPSFHPSFRPSQDIFRRIFLSNCWWQKSDIWSQASYRYAILWEAFLDPLASDSYFLFADFVDFYTHWTYMLIFRHKLHIGTPYRGKRFFTRHIPTSCLAKSGGGIISEH